MKSLILTILIVVSSMASAATRCHSIFADKTKTNEQSGYPFSSLILDSQKIPKGDGYTRKEHRENFWSIHEQYGFITELGKTFLLAKSKQVIEPLMKDLKNAKKEIDSIDVSNKNITIAKNTSDEIGEAKGFLVDVTSLIPNKFLGLNEYHSPSDGPNCWNLAMYLSQVSFSLHETSPKEFKFFIESPLAKKLSETDFIQAGDIIVFRNGSDEVHAAVFLSPRLVISKNGTEETRPYRIMALNEMAAQYHNPHPIFGTRLSDQWFVVRLSPLNKYVNENRARLSTNILAAYESLHVLEGKINFSVLPDSKYPLEKSEISTLVSSFKQKYQVALEKEKAQSTADSESYFLSSAILMRLESLVLF